MRMIKRVGLIVLFNLILIACIGKAADMVQRKDSDFKYKPFFEQKEDFDVLFMGTSHVINGVFPMELWNDYGIVSYNFGGHANAMATTYWVMQNALDYTKPKLMVIDVFTVHENTKTFLNSDYVHLSLDGFPVTPTKIKGVYDLFDDPDYVDEFGIKPYDYKWEFIWDFGKYHSRWNELKQEEFSDESVSKEKGAQSRLAVSAPKKYPILPKTEVMEDNQTVGMEYLRKIIEDCQRRNIEVLLVNLPYPANEVNQRAANSVYDVAEEYGVDYINFVAMNHIVDYNTDCYDEASHLNPSGARKVTKYLGQYIKEHYDIPDRRTDDDYRGWFDDYQKYVDYKIGNLQERHTLKAELMLLADKGFSSCIYVKGNSPVCQDESVRNLLSNLSGGKSLLKIDEAIETGTDYCLVTDTVSGKILESAGNDSAEWDTSFGPVSFIPEKDVPELYIKNMDMNQLYGEWFWEGAAVLEPDVQVFVINNETGEIVASTRWDYSKEETIERREE